MSDKSTALKLIAINNNLFHVCSLTLKCVVIVFSEHHTDPHQLFMTLSRNLTMKVSLTADILKVKVLSNCELVMSVS